MQTTAPELRTLWLNDMLDPSDHMSFPFMSSFSRSEQMRGQRRTYGNGRLRAYVEPGVPEDWSVELPNCTREQLAWLKAHAGRTLIARDDRGGRIFCVYYDREIDELAHVKEGSTSLALLEVTASLAV